MARWGGVPTAATVVTVIVAVIAFMTGTADTTLCGPCDIGACGSTESCANGVALDSCDCCQVCAKRVNETCGGPHDVLGTCGDGLRCFLSVDVGQQITGDEPGLCHTVTTHAPTKCTSFTCADAGVLSCPFDSYRSSVINEASRNCCANATVAGCACNTSVCRVVQCRVGEVPMVEQTATGNPGQCCNITKCLLSEKCSGIVCPDQVIEQETCPADSFKPASVVSEDGCCEITQRCKCRVDECKTSECPDGLKVQILSKRNESPGMCCDVFKCINDSKLSCMSEGREYANNETWLVDKCTHCVCKDGLKFCQAEKCPSLLCGWMEVPKGHCCPICKGCVSPDLHRLYNNSDSWQENKCLHCRCVDGQPVCASESCRVKCDKPRYLHDRCCPICDEPNQSEQREYCNDLSGCTRTCRGGRRTDKRGCYLCGCRAVNCPLKCKHGLVVDSDGDQACKCVKPAQICRPLIGCNKDCMYGFRKSRYGCKKCRCNKCSPFLCKKKCPRGFMYNDKGCEICKCRDVNEPTTTSTIVPQDKVCLSEIGLTHEDGETWHDGCRRCFCHNGKEMCYLIRCGALTCVNPVFRLGDCCPSCPGTTVKISTKPPVEACETVDGHHLTEGETWQMDSCTECICHKGLILCETRVCLPLLCHYPVKHESQCCPSCHMKHVSTAVATLKPRSCYTSDKVTYKHGAVWRVNPCQSCTCRHALIHCYSQMCAPLNCHRITLRKGQCCPVCLKEKHTLPCHHGEEVYSEGEEWQHECSLCHCAAGGETRCINITCPFLKCFVLVRKPNTCCPVCLEESGYTLTGQHAVHPFHTRSGNRSTVRPNVPSGRKTQPRSNVVTVVTLSVLLSVVLVAMTILVVILLRKRRTGLFKASDNINVLTDYRVRPKSTNLDLQGTMPFLYDIKLQPKSFGHKYDNNQTPVGTENRHFSETGMLIDSGDKWKVSTTDTSLSSTA